MADKFLMKKTRIRVIGIGGGGGSIVSELAKRVKKANFLAANTDEQALKKTPKNVYNFQFGKELTDGLGTGMDPKIGEVAAQKEKQRIRRIIKDRDFCIFVASLGGGTGSGSAPVFAEVAKESKCITLGIFTLPFKFEGERKMRTARKALAKLRPNLDGILVINNQKIFKIIDKKTSLDKSFSTLNSILAENIENLIELIYRPGLINIDFADFKSILGGKGEKVYFSSAEAKGVNRAEEAVKKVLNSPIIDFNIKSGKKILFNIAGSENLKMAEVEKICKSFADLNKRSKIVFGVSSNPPSKKNSIRVTLLVVGDEGKKKAVKFKKPKEVEKVLEEKVEEKKVKPKKKKPKKKKKRKKKRLTAIDVKNAVKEEEEKRLAEEEKWDVPAFLRRSPWKEKAKKSSKKK